MKINESAGIPKTYKIYDSIVCHNIYGVYIGEICALSSLFRNLLPNVLQ